MNLIEKARKLREIIEGMAVNLDDATAIESAELFPAWDGNGVVYVADQRVRYNGVLYKILQTHTSQPDWSPEVASSLFARVLIPDPEVIPVWVQPDSTNAYMIGDKVYYPDENGLIYESVIDNNVWSPETYPAGWAIVAE